MTNVKIRECVEQYQHANNLDVLFKKLMKQFQRKMINNCHRSLKSFYGIYETIVKFSNTLISHPKWKFR